ncbi:DUF2786 domain-containing protein [Spirillospora albida]|uniref:DUF2786 domain-containing protein n=1 Tax=Spirillospora albida TaxID=58123 RepID=UPI001470634C|nr:DUF2786 domain-containing protein [Spirillospora albida]
MALEAVEGLAAAALHALSRGDASAFDHLVTELAGDPGVPGWTRAADRCLSLRLRAAVQDAWERGWQPGDVARFTGRRHTARHVRLARDAIAAQMRRYPSSTVDDRWREQLAHLKAEVWWGDDHEHPAAWCAREGAGRTALIACSIEVLHLLHHLPRLPRIGPLPGTSRQGPAVTANVDGRVLGRVRALLAKAESTEFPDEAEALSARAQELMARHSIDRALLEADAESPCAPAGRRVPIESPYDAPKAALLTVVSDANRCRAVWHRDLGFSTVVGFPADVAGTEMLFTSLLVQATSAMVSAGPRRDARGASRTRSFRHAFLNAYAGRIGERLREATERAATGEALPVLAARDRAVDDAVGALFPRLARSRASSVSNREGWLAGRMAADLAGLRDRAEIAHRA